MLGLIALQLLRVPHARKLPLLLRRLLPLAGDALAHHLHLVVVLLGEVVLFMHQLLLVLVLERVHLQLVLLCCECMCGCGCVRVCV